MFRPLPDEISLQMLSQGRAKLLCRRGIYKWASTDGDTEACVGIADWTALMCACQQGSIACMQLLLDAGADPNASSSVGPQHTPLTLAAQARSLAAIEMLLARGVQVTNAIHADVLHYAVQPGAKRKQCGCSSPATCGVCEAIAAHCQWLEDACSGSEQDATAVVAALARAGFSLHCLPSTEGLTGYPLDMAVRANSTVLVRALLRAGASAQYTIDPHSLLADVITFCHQDHEVLSQLLDKEQQWGKGALQLAMQSAIDSKCQTCTALLCSRMGKRIDAFYQHEPALTPVMQACMYSDDGVAVLSTLLSHGAKADGVPAGHFPTSLWTAAMNLCEPVAQLLLARGANPTARSPRTGCTLLMLAAALGDHRMTALLLKHAPQLRDMTDTAGWGPLMWAYHQADMASGAAHLKVASQLRRVHAGEMQAADFGRANTQARTQLDSAVAWALIAVRANWGPEMPTNDTVVVPPADKPAWVYPQRVAGQTLLSGCRSDDSPTRSERGNEHAKQARCKSFSLDHQMRKKSLQAAVQHSQRTAARPAATRHARKTQADAAHAHSGQAAVQAGAKPAHSAPVSGSKSCAQTNAGDVSGLQRTRNAHSMPLAPHSSRASDAPKGTRHKQAAKRRTQANEPYRTGRSIAVSTAAAQTPPIQHSSAPSPHAVTGSSGTSKSKRAATQHDYTQTTTLGSDDQALADTLPSPRMWARHAKHTTTHSKAVTRRTAHEYSLEEAPTAARMAPQPSSSTNLADKQSTACSNAGTRSPAHDCSTGQAAAAAHTVPQPSSLTILPVAVRAASDAKARDAYMLQGSEAVPPPAEQRTWNQFFKKLLEPQPSASESPENTSVPDTASWPSD